MKKPSKEGVKIVTLRFPDRLHHKLRILASWRGQSLTDMLGFLVEEAYQVAGLPEPEPSKEAPEPKEFTREDFDIIKRKPTKKQTDTKE